MGSSSKFWDKIADKYAKQPVADEAAYQKKLEITRGYFRPDMDVLELGCGTGSTAIVHAPHVKHIRAVDISANMIAIAKGKSENDDVSNIDFEVGSIEAIETDEARYDVILAMSLLHLLEDKEAAIGKILKLLKPGGVFVSSTACIADKMPWFCLIAALGRFVGAFPLVKVFGVKQLRQSIREGGFEIDQEWRPEKAIAVFIVAKKPG